MKIVFFGSSLVSACWNGAATYYRGLLSALAARSAELVVKASGVGVFAAAATIPPAVCRFFAIRREGRSG